MFVMKIPAEAEELIAQLEEQYPRAAKNIRIAWSHEPDCREFLQDMVSHTSGKTPAGFSLNAITLISQILEIYDKQLEEVQAINKSKDEIAIRVAARNNVWSKLGIK